MFRKEFRVKANIVTREKETGTITLEARCFYDLRKDKHKKKLEEHIIGSAYESEGTIIKEIDITSIQRIG